MPLGAALCSTVFQGFAVAQSPTAHGIQPRPGEVFCGGRSAPLVIVACKLSSRTFLVTDPFLHGAGKEKQLVVTTSVGMQLRQKQPPHMPILEKRGSVNISCSIHEKNLLPSFSSILCQAKISCKAHYRASATLRRANQTPPPYVASWSASRSYPVGTPTSSHTFASARRYRGKNAQKQRQHPWQASALAICWNFRAKGEAAHGHRKENQRGNRKLSVGRKSSK